MFTCFVVIKSFNCKDKILSRLLKGLKLKSQQFSLDEFDEFMIKVYYYAAKKKYDVPEFRIKLQFNSELLKTENFKINPDLSLCSSQILHLIEDKYAKEVNILLKVTDASKKAANELKVVALEDDLKNIRKSFWEGGFKPRRQNWWLAEQNFLDRKKDELEQFGENDDISRFYKEFNLKEVFNG